MLQDIWYTVYYWVEDNLQYVLTALLVLVVVTVIVLVKVSGGEDETTIVQGVKKDTLEEVEAVKELSYEVDEVFSLLSERPAGIHEEFPGYEFDLFLKKPFITSLELEEKINLFIDIYKWKENFNLSGVKIRLYDRKEVYEKNLIPRAEIYYAKKLEQHQILTVDEGGERLSGDLVFDDNFRETVDMGKRPDYSTYDLRILNFTEMDASKGVTPLTDQEFSFYLKQDLYKLLAGGNSYGGIMLYLQWDLGKNIYRDGIVSIEREFSNFTKRHTGVGGQISYYDNEYIVQQELAVEKPQFLLFTLTKKVVEDPLDAQRELIKLNPELFRTVIEEDVERQVEKIGEEEEEEEDVPQKKGRDEIEVEDNNTEGSGGYIEFKGSGG